MKTHDDDAAILAELVALAHGEPHLELLQFRSLVSAHQYKHLYALMRRYVPMGAEVLDWGVGNGHFSYYLLRRGYQVTGFSLTPCALQARLTHEGYRFIQGDAGEPVTLPFPDHTFEAVVSVGVLEHVREIGGDEGASLQEIRRVLQPGGWFICYHLPNRYSLVEALVRRLSQKYSHPYRFSRGDVRRMLQEAALELLYIRRYGGLPRNIWHAPPPWLRNSRLVAWGWDGLDRLLDTLFTPICQNHCFVTRRPSDQP